MKKTILILLSVSILLICFPNFSYAANKTPEISLDEFSAEYKELQSEYDGELVSDIVFEENSDFYHLNGELMPLCDEYGNELSVDIDDKNVELPKAVLDENSAEIEEIETTEKSSKRNSKITVDEDYAEAIGYELEINDDKAVLTQPYQTHRLIVKSKYDINPLDSVEIVEGYNDLHIVQFDDLESTEKALEYYEKQRNIEYAEPDLIVSTLEYEDTEPNENADLNRKITYANHLSWGSESIGADDYIDYLGDIETLPEIVVGIIDTGVELEHELLKDRIIRTDFNVSYSGEPDSENDDYGHGTHVAGIVVDNTTENVKIKGYKVLSNEGSGSLASVCLGIEQAVADSVNIINMSLGSRGNSITMNTSVSNAVKNGITVCVSAGNSALPAEWYTPAGIESCITVGAIDEDDIKPLFSNWGDLVDVVAPGVDINSSFLGNTYKSLSGTSMASPFAAAASALILSKMPNLNCSEVCAYLQDNGRAWYDERDSIYIDSLYGVPAVYIGNMSSFDMERTPAPQFSVDGGRYSNSITLELTCEDENAKIYYTLDGTRATENNGTLYTEPIFIDKITRVHAVAYSEGKLKSLQTVDNYYILSLDPEGNFQIASNGIITAYNGDNPYLIIPDKINGITVRGIGNSVFNKSKVKDTLTMIRLPETVTYIGDKCFYACGELWSVEGGNILNVGKYGFACHKLEKIDLSTMEEIGEYAFSQNRGITEIKNDNIEIINKSTFYGMHNVIYVDLPNVTYVDTWGLNNLMNAETILLPNVRHLGKQALMTCRMVKELDLPCLEVMSGEGQFKGMVNLKEINMPNFTGVVPKEAFYLDYSLNSIDISGATSIEEEAFAECSGLTSITLGNNLTSIGKNAFKNCSNITDVYYDGTKTEWDRIKGKELLEYATIHYSLDNTALLAAIAQAKACSNAEYTKESLEALYAFADSFISLANSHAEQEEYDSAVAQILNAIRNLDALSNYDIASFNGTVLTLINKDGKTTSLSFSEFVNKRCKSLDVVDDGVVNAKDYAYLIKNYS